MVEPTAAHAGLREREPTQGGGRRRHWLLERAVFSSCQSLSESFMSLMSLNAHQNHWGKAPWMVSFHTDV